MHGTHILAKESARRLTRRGKPLRGWLTALAALLLLGMLVTGWWRCRIPTFQLSGRYPAYDATLLASTNGFWVREAPQQFVFRDWQGHERWRIDVAVSRIPEHDGDPRVLKTVRAHPQSDIYFSASPNGRVFAASTADGPRTRIQIWQDGTLTADLILPVSGDSASERFITALDSGRVFTWENAANWRLFAIEKGRIIAGGHVAANSMVTPDGAALVTLDGSGFLYATLAVHDRVLQITPRYHTPEFLLLNWHAERTREDAFFTNGLVMTPNGAVYGSTGRLIAPNRWRRHAIAPGFQYMVQYVGEESRVYAPLTGEAWTFIVDDFNKGGSASADGRFALTRCQTRIPPTWLRTLQKLPAPGTTLQRTSLDYLALYERPGRLRAVLRLDLVNRLPELLRFDNYEWCPSPDGHTLAMTLSEGASECLVFRW